MSAVAAHRHHLDRAARSPNVTGQIEDRRAHWTIFSTLVA
jgi:hypothetical protein